MSRCKVLILALLALVSCKGYLTVQPQGKVIPQTDEEFASIIHRYLCDIEGGADEYIIGNMETIARLEGCADDLDANIRPGNGLPAYAGEVINRRMTDYRESYAIIKDCNIVIENLDGRDTPTARGARGAALAIKGIVYYNLIRDFCPAWEDGSEPGLPLVDRFDIEASPSRSSLGETIRYADAVLQEASDLCPLGPEFFFTGDMIDLYRARLAFWKEDWAACESLCRKLLSGKDLSANDVLAQSHINDSSELDWYFQYVKGYIASRPVSASLVSLFDADDSRPAQYWDAKRFNTKVPERRLRLTEAVLMLSECLAHQGGGKEVEALRILNELRASRNAPAITVLSPVRNDRIKADATGAPLCPLMQAILDERRKELYMEGDRFYELKRNGSPEWWVIVGGLKYTTREYLYTAPLYKGDIALNPSIVQNPGYED